MIVRASKDGSGFQVETDYGDTEHILTVSTKRDDKDGDRVVLTGTFDGDIDEWAEVADRIGAIHIRYGQERAGE